MLIPPFDAGGNAQIGIEPSPLFADSNVTARLIGSRRRETKNSNFSLIYEAECCGKVLKYFGKRTEGDLIVNGHVPAKVESGESAIASGCWDD